MPQREVELILTRQLASHLTVPVFLVDEDGHLIYYNEAAEPILGMRFHETGGMARDRWTTAFMPCDESGEPIEPDMLPLTVALREGRPVHRRLVITSMDSRTVVIEVAAIPLVAQAGRTVGGLAMFWEAKQQ